MSDEKSKNPIDEIEHRYFARGRTHGIIQVIVFWVVAILLDLLSMELRHSKLFNPIFYYTILVSNILVIPIYLLCEKKLCDGERDGNYLEGYVTGNIVAYVLVVVFFFTPLADLVFHSYPFYEPGDGELIVNYYMFIFLPPYIIGFLLTLIIRTIIKHIENKKRNQNEHRVA